MKTPADLGIEAVKQENDLRDAAKDFEAFCRDAIADGHGEGMDHITFLKNCLEVYIELTATEE